MPPSLIAHWRVGRQTLSLLQLEAINSGWMGPELLVRCLVHLGSSGAFILLQIFSEVVWLSRELKLPGRLWYL